MKRLLLLSMFIYLSCSTNYDFSRVVAPTDVQKSDIQEIVKKDFSIKSIYSIKTNDFNNVYFVAGIINGAGVTNEIAVWATNSYDKSEMWYSVNAIARVVSDVPPSSELKEPITMLNDGATILSKYLEKEKEK